MPRKLLVLGADPVVDLMSPVRAEPDREGVCFAETVESAGEARRRSEGVVA